MNELALRAMGAAATVLAYAGLCAGIWTRERRRAGHLAARAAKLAGGGNAVPTLVLFGSQTGQAESIAWQTAEWLQARGEPARVRSLNATSLAELQAARRALFVASTYGEGDAPDGASVFAQQLMREDSATQLPNLRFAVFALGDREYDNFCGFGRRLDDWLEAAGAQREHERVEADNLDASALDAWRLRIGGTGAAPGPSQACEPLPWRLVAREQVNAASQGAPMFHLAFAPASSRPFSWQAGDLAQLAVPADPARPRDYSIASIPEDGELHLLVRQERHPDGTLGAASGLLTEGLPVGAVIDLRLRPNANFQLGENAGRPLLLNGNGSGLAGLRALLRQQARNGQRENWLVFGERNARWDRPYGDELERWQADGTLARLDLVFSRDQAERRYVQHRLLQAGEDIVRWLDRDAAIYVCGSLQGMGTGVDAALRQILGNERLLALSAQGRYRRDVY